MVHLLERFSSNTVNESDSTDPLKEDADPKEQQRIQLVEQFEKGWYEQNSTIIINGAGFHQAEDSLSIRAHCPFQQDVRGNREKR